MIEPKPLKKGGTIAIVAPAGPLEAEIIFQGKNYYKVWGLRSL